MAQIPDGLVHLGPEAFEAWGRFGEWLNARFTDVRVNSVGHLVVPSPGRPAFMVGIDEGEHGIVADLHSPFLVEVPRDPQTIEIVAMNQGMSVLGSVRIVPEDDSGASFTLELRHQVHASMLNQEWLYAYADMIPSISAGLVTLLHPAVGGVPFLSA